MKKNIPETQLRYFYNILKNFSTETQLNISKDFNRDDNYKKLSEIYFDSKLHFSNKYDNSGESFFGSRERKDLLNMPETITSTNTAATFFKSSDVVSVDNNRKLSFKYIEREVSTIRTTKAIFDSGKSGKSSGTGGLDFIGLNSIDKCPILGEIKINSDKNAFYALIQLLTYLSEISTANQIERINKHSLFGTEVQFNKDTKFYLYIVLTQLTEKRKEIFSEVERLAERVKSEIKEIKDIVFLKIDTETKKINQILDYKRLI